MGFFWRWWQEQTDQMKTTVRNLVSAGQLEFINAGWCMNDEGNYSSCFFFVYPFNAFKGTVNYEATIDQMTKGHQFLQQEFGFTPKIGWQIDPFGHASNHVSRLFSTSLLESDQCITRLHCLLRWDSMLFSCIALIIKIGCNAIKLRISSSL